MLLKYVIDGHLENFVIINVLKLPTACLYV